MDSEINKMRQQKITTVMLTNLHFPSLCGASRQYGQHKGNLRKIRASMLLTLNFAKSGKYQPSALHSASVTVKPSRFLFRSWIVSIPHTSTRCANVPSALRLESL